MKICNSQKFIWNRGYIYMPVSLNKENLPEIISILENELVIKDEFHVSLFCNKNIADEVYKKFPNIEQEILEIFCAIELSNEISFDKFLGEYRLAERKLDNRKSLIAMVSVKNLDIFYNKINEKFGLDLEYPPTHISLYTLEKNKAIGINNGNDLDNLTKKVSLNLRMDIKLE